MRKLTVYDLNYILRPLVKRKIIDNKMLKGVVIRINKTGFINNYDIDFLNNNLLLIYGQMLCKGNLKRAFELRSLIIKLLDYSTIQTADDIQIFLDFLEKKYNNNIKAERIYHFINASIAEID